MEYHLAAFPIDAFAESLRETSQSNRCLTEGWM